MQTLRRGWQASLSSRGAYILVPEIHEHRHLIHKLHLRAHGRTSDGFDCHRNRFIHDALVHLQASYYRCRQHTDDGF